MEEQYAEIIVDVAHSSVDKIFDYALIEGMDVQRGRRVIVHFGNMRTEGIVLSKKEQTDLPKNKIRQVERVVDEQPVVTSEQISLAQYMCAKYHATMAFCLRLMFPAKMRGERIRPREVRVATLIDEGILKQEETRCYTKEGLVRAKNRLKTIQALQAEKKDPTAE